MTMRILVVKLADLGDLLLCEPALRSLRTAFPEAELDLLVSPGSIQLARLIGHGVHPVQFAKNRFDHAVDVLNPVSVARALALAIRFRRKHYSMVVLLHHLTTAGGAMKFHALAVATASPIVAGLENGRGAFLTHSADDLGFGARYESEYMLAVALAAGGHAVDSRPRFPLESVGKSPVSPQQYAVIHPVTGGYASARTWMVERWAEVAERLDRNGLTPVIVGSADASGAAAFISAHIARAVDLTSRTTIPELAGLISGATCVLGGDSFVGHLASALNRPTVSVFGPSNADAWRPFGDPRSNRVVLHTMPCQPCIYTGFSLGRPSGCPDRTCLRLVSVDDVVAAANSASEASHDF